MEGASGFTASIIDELLSSDIQGDQLERESGVTGSIIDEFHSSYIRRDQMEGESSVTGSIFDELHSLDIHEIKRKVKPVLHEVSLIDFIPWIANKIKW